MFQSDDKSMTGAEWDWADIMGWGLVMDSGDHWEKKQWQKTASREQKWDRGEMRQEAKWVSVERRYVKQWWNVIFCCFILHHKTYIFPVPQVLKFIIAKTPPVSYISPASSLPSIPLLSPADKPLSWYSSRPLAPHFICNPVDCYLQVERLSNCLLLPDYQRWEKDMAARCWSRTWGGLWVTDMLSLTTDNKCFSPGLISASIGQLKRWEFTPLPELKLQRRNGAFCCSATCW